MKDYKEFTPAEFEARLEAVREVLKDLGAVKSIEFLPGEVIITAWGGDIFVSEMLNNKNYTCVEVDAPVDNPPSGSLYRGDVSIILEEYK